MDPETKYVDKFRVPDPGAKYWNSLPDRIRARTSAAAAARPSLLRRRNSMIFACGAAVALFLVASELSERPTFHPPAFLPEPPMVSDAKITASLAERNTPTGIFAVLGRSAMEKADRAAIAFARGERKALLPLARAYEKIVFSGILKSLRKATDEDRDIPDEELVYLRESLGRRRLIWERIATSINDDEILEVLGGALYASVSLSCLLDELSPEEKG
jgi:hypothetical protein